MNKKLEIDLILDSKLDSKMVVYLILNLVDGKYYVGKTERKLLQRWKEHLWFNPRYALYLNRAMNKYERNNFTLEVLGSCTTREELSNLEKLWIIALRSYDPEIGYNQTFGGDGSG